MTSPARSLAANVRRLRQARSLSVVELARSAGIGRATLTQLEAGAGNPTLETLYARATVRGGPRADLIADAGAPSVARGVGAGAGEAVSGAAVHARLLHRGRSSHSTLEVYAVVVRGGTTQTSQAHPAGTREHRHVHAGALEAGPAASSVRLGPGDYADYAADVEHVYRVEAAADAVATLVIVTPTPPGGL